MIDKRKFLPLAAFVAGFNMLLAAHAAFRVPGEVVFGIASRELGLVSLGIGAIFLAMGFAFAIRLRKKE